jgi:PAS domain S-box-containing protein
MNRMKPGLFLFFGIWSAILIAAGLMAFTSVRGLRGDAEWVSHSHEVLETAQTALTSLVDAETGERGYLLTGNPTFLEPYQSALDRLDAETRQLEALVQDNPRQTTRVHRLKQLISSKLGSLAQIIARNGSDPAAARRMVTAGLEKQTMDGLRAEFRAFRGEELALLLEREQADRHTYRIATLAGILYGMLGLAGFGGLLLQVLRHTRDRANYEEDLEAQRALLKVTLESVGDALISTDAEGRVVFMNPVAEALTGWSAVEASGHPLEKVFQIIHEKTGEPAFNPVGRVLQEGIVLGLANHTALVNRAGKAIPIEDSAAPIKDPAGAVIGIVLVFHDVTEKRKVENELSTSERRFRELTELSPSAIWINRDERIEHANPEGHRLLGATTPGELTGKSIYEIWHPDSHDKVRARLRAVAAGQVVHLSQETIIRLDGSLRQVEVSSAPIEDAKGPAVQCVVRDVTQRMAIEQELRRSEEGYRTLFNSLMEGFCVIDVLFDDDGQPVDYRFLEINPAFEAQTGLVHALGKRMRELAPDHEAHWFEIYGKVALTGEAIRFVNEAKALNRWYEVRAYRLGGAGSSRVAILFNDISERIRTEEERMRLEARTTQAQRLESLGVLVAGIAHNFNNIMTVIMGTASIQEELGAGGDELEALKVIINACERGRSLVSSLTHFARPTLAQQVSLEVNHLAAEVAGLVGNTTKRVEILQEYAQEPLWITGDPGSLGSVFMNLCLNSLDAMPEGGTLSIRTSVPRQGWVEVAVEDSGEGMPPEVLAHATEPFFTTKPVGKGTGLGLSMAHGMTQAHGGTLEITSTPGQGTQARIRLPRLPVPEPSAPAPSQPPSRMPFRVLLVDDEAEIRFVLARMLRNAGIEQVHAVAGGQEALDTLRAGAVPDLVILDQHMPGLDGVHTLAQLRLSHPHLPVLVASGQPGIQEWDAFKQANVAVISKPFSLKEIEVKLAEMGIPGRRNGWQGSLRKG